MSRRGSPILATAHGNRFMFAGREYIQQLGLYDYRNRFYSPELGRFLQADPLRFGAGNANIYRYVGNSPINATDPLGLCEDDNPLGFGPPEDFVDDLTKDLLNGGGDDGPVTPRFDADGKLELGEANEWYRNGNGQPVAVDADCYDFSQVNPSGFNPETGRQPYTFPEFKGGLPSDDFLVNGTVTLQLDPDGQSFSVLPDTYDFEMHSWADQPIRNIQTIIGNVIANPNPFTHGTPHQIIFYNSVPLPAPSQK